VQAIVLVGGEGTRLRPLTATVPKPALTLVDRPFLAYMIEWLAGHGVTEVVLACGFLPDVLRGALAGEEERAGVSIRYVVEPERRGTAGAIRFAADELGDHLDERFLALNGDVLTDLDLTALLRTHAERDARATLGLHPVEDSSAYGLVHSDPQGAVLEFLEKTGESVPGEINAGMYVLERSVLDLIPAGEEVSIERDVFPRLVGDGLHGLRLDGYWMDIGTPERYLQASWDILERRVETRVQPTAPGMLVGSGAEIATGATIGPRAVLGSGCKVADGAEVRDSVVLDGCKVGEGARVSGSILSAGVEVAAGAVLESAVVGADERVPA
jgi:mannose-1-phosphate guanylyltransferase